MARPARTKPDDREDHGPTDLVASAMMVWTIGHSTHTLDAFVALLDAHEIAQVADIRRVPRSRRSPRFDGNALARSLPERALDYVHLPRLGGWRHAGADAPNGGWQNRSFRAYADYAMTEDFADGLAHLRAIAAAGRCVVMCSEALWWRCHRRLVADRLVVAGDTVCPIGSSGRLSAHRLTPFAIVEPDRQISYPAARLPQSERSSAARPSRSSQQAEQPSRCARIPGTIVSASRPASSSST